MSSRNLSSRIRYLFGVRAHVMSYTYDLTIRAVYEQYMVPEGERFY